MILFSSTGFLIVLILLIGCLLGWLLNWLLDSLWGQRRIVRVERQDVHTHRRHKAHAGRRTKKIKTDLGPCAAKCFTLEPEWIEPTCGTHQINLPTVRPCFELRWGDSARDRLETEGVETLCIVATNPYSNVLLRNVTLALITVTHSDGSAAPMLPDDTPAIDLTPAQLVRFGDLAPSSSSDPQAVSSAICEVTLTCESAEPGAYHFKLWCDYGVIFTMQQTAPYRLLTAPDGASENKET